MEIYGIYRLVMTNIAMDNPRTKWRVVVGKIIYRWVIYTMAMLNNQRVSLRKEWISAFPARVYTITIYNHGIHHQSGWIPSNLGRLIFTRMKNHESFQLSVAMCCLVNPASHFFLEISYIAILNMARSKSLVSPLKIYGFSRANCQRWPEGNGRW